LKKSEPKILIYAQDQGGARFMGPVLKAMAKADQHFSYVIVVHPLSMEIFTERQIPFMPLRQAANNPPVSVYDWSQFIKKEHIAGVFCTTSSPYLDLSNCHLIAACRKLSIPVMGILDHWKGFDRFYKDDIPEYMPEYICCIDDICRQRLEGLGLRSDQIHVVGHPYLETICRQACRAHSHHEWPRVLLVSQPNTTDRSFRSIYSYSVAGRRLIDQIATMVEAINLRSGLACRLRYRSHPKERLFEDMPQYVEMDVSPRWDQSVREHEVFMGLDSMALVEAHLAGKYCIKLGLEEFQGLSDNSIPFSFSGNLADLSVLPSELEKAIETISKDTGECRAIPPLLIDSTERTLEVLNRFSLGSLSS